MKRARLSELTRKRIEHYALNEPSFTIPFAAWELKLSKSAIELGVHPLIKSGQLVEIEPACGPYAATYTVKPKRNRKGRKPAKRRNGHDEIRLKTTILRTKAEELEDRRVAYVTEGPS